MSGFLTTAQAAQRLNRSRDTIYRYIRSGDLEAVRLTPNGDYLIPEKNLIEFVTAATTTRTRRNKKKTLSLLRELSA